MNHNKLSEPGDYYQEIDGEVLPPVSEPEVDESDSLTKAEVVARAFSEKNDELTREVFPSEDMNKAYQISRRLLELNDHDFAPQDKKEDITTQEKLINGTTLEKGHKLIKKWYTDKRTKERKSYSVSVAFVVRVRDDKKIYLASDRRIPEQGASKFILSEWDELEKRIDRGEGREIK